MKHPKKEKEESMEMEHSESEKMQDHEISSGIETLHQAHKIMKNKHKMKQIKHHIGEKHSAIMEMVPKEDDEVTSIKDIKKKSNKMAMKKYE